MNRKTYSRFCCLAVFLFLAVFFPSQAHAYSSFPVRFNFFSGVESAPDTVSPYRHSDGRFYLYAPADCELSEIILFFDNNLSVTVDGTPVCSGESTEAFSVSDREYIFRFNGASFPLTVLQSTDLPSVFLNTESGSLESVNFSKSFSEKGSISIYEKGEQSLSSDYKKIRLRGNGSSTYPKRSYNLSFYSKTSLFGMPKAKKWAFIANYTDNTRIRNVLGLRLARDSKVPFSSDSALADLYINGEYYGLFQIAESVELGKGRVELPDLDKANERANLGIDISSLYPSSKTLENGLFIKGFDIESPDNISGGFLLELQTFQRVAVHESAFITVSGLPVTLRSPKRASTEEVEYIAILFNEADEAIRSESGFNSSGKHYSDYFDLDSLARTYILEEFSMDMDSILTSTFFYKPKNEDKFYACCEWDFDHAFFTKYGTSPRYGFDIGDPTKWYARNSYHLQNFVTAGDDLPSYFQILFRTEGFRSLVRSLWREVRPAYVAAIDDLPALSDATRPSVIMDSYLYPVQLIKEDYQQRSDAIRGYAEQLVSDCETRLAFLDEGFSENAAYLYYDMNGGRGFTISTPLCMIGEEIELETTGFAIPKNTNFNTEPDGSGTSYHFGDKIRLTEPVTVLYAMWK